MAGKRIHSLENYQVVKLTYELLILQSDIEGVLVSINITSKSHNNEPVLCLKISLSPICYIWNIRFNMIYCQTFFMYYIYKRHLSINF